MNVNKPAQQRALAGKQRKVKDVKMTYLRNNVIRTLAVVLPALLVVVMVLDNLGTHSAYPIKRVEYHGSFKFVGKEVVDEVAVESIDGNFFTTNLVKLKQDIEAINWVKSAQIDKKWPSKLNISVVEYQPIAKWSEGGWVSEEGHLITGDDMKASEQVFLPTFKGKLTNVEVIKSKFIVWKSILEEVGLSVNELSLSNASSWQVVLSSNEIAPFELKLGALGNVKERLLRFTKLFDQNKAQFINSEYVDARYPDGIAIKYLTDVNDDLRTQLSKRIIKNRLKMLDRHNQSYVFNQLYMQA